MKRCQFTDPERPPGRAARDVVCLAEARWYRYQPDTGYRHMFACDDHKPRIVRDAMWWDEEVRAVGDGR